MKILHLLDKFGLKNLAMKSMVWLSTILLVSSAYANPVLNNVGAGRVQIQQTNPNSTVIHQSSQKVILNWNSFNIGPNQSTRFQQPAGGVALNRISPTEGASAIYGRLTATGQIILINPAGIFFGPNAYVKVGGLIATTSNISDTNFLSGNYQFNQPSPYAGASIINEGQIIAAKHGLVALVAPNVINRGLIQANLGSVVLGSGSAFTVSFDNGGLINFAVDKKTMGPGNVTNTGRIIANGGSVLVTARAAQGVLDSVINMEGIIQARSVGMRNGEVIFSGDNDAGVVRVAANIDVSGKGRGQTGGNVQITGHNILIDNPTVIDASGNRRGGNILIGGNYQGKGPLPNANATVLMPEASLIANATTLGKGGNVILWADDLTRAYGSISARGGKYGGDGGFIETSGKKYLDVAGIRVDTSAPHGKFGMWLLDPSDLAISSGATSGVDQVGNVFSPTTDFGFSNLNDLELISALGSTNVTVQTVNDAGAGSGDILVCFPSCNNSNTITWNSGTTLTLDSFHDVQFFGNINGGGLTVVSGAGGTIFLLSASPTYTTTGSQSWQGPVTVVGVSPTFTSTGGSINFTSSIAGNAGNENIVISGAGSVAGVISNINSFTKAGNGSFNLQGTNTYDGATNVNAGTLLVTNDSGLGSLVGSTTVANGATLAFNGVTAGEALTINGTGVSGAGALTGTSTTLNGGITLGSDSTIGGTGAFTISGVIDGAFGLTKVGSGNLTLDAANTYTGTTTINAGTITATNAGSFGTTAAGTIINSGGILLLDNVGISNEALTLNGGSLRGTGVASWTSDITLGTGTTNTFNSVDTSLDVIGDINGAGSLSLIGAGTVAVVGNIGNVTRLTDFSANANAAVDANVSTNGNQTYDNVVLIGRDLSFDAGGDITFNADIDGDGNHDFNLASDGTITFSGTVGAGTPLQTLSILASAININGGSVSTLGTQLYDGATNLGANTTINAGTGTVTFTNTLNSSGANRTLAINTSGLTTFSGNVGGTLPLSTFTSDGAGSTTFGTSVTFTTSGAQTHADALIPGSGTTLVSTGDAINISGDVTGGGGSFTVNNAASSTISGAMDLISFVKEGVGVLILSSTSNSYTGSTTINAGTLRLGAANVIPNASAVILANVATAILDLNNNNETIASLSGGGTTGGNITLGSGTLTTGGAGATTTYAGRISGSGGLTSTGGTLSLTGNNNYTGVTNITGGTLRAGHVNALGTAAGGTVVASGATLDINNVIIVSAEAISLSGTGVGGNGALTGTGLSSLAGNITLLANSAVGVATSGVLILAGIISDGGSTFDLTKLGSGVAIVTRANTYDGVTTISQGTLSANDPNALGTTTGGTVIASGAALLINNVDIGTEALNVTGSGIGGQGAITSTGTAISSGAMTLAGDVTIGGTGTYALNGDITDGASSFSLTKVGSSVLTLGGTNTYDGGTTVTAGTLAIGANNALPTNTALSVNSTFDLNGFSQQLSQISGSGTATNTSGTASTLTLDVSGTNSFAGTLAGNMAITKSNSGTLTLSGNNSYTGVTTINDGILSVANAAALGTVAGGTVVNSGGTLNIANVSVGTEGLTLNGTGALTSGSSSSSWAGNIALGLNSTIDTTGTLSLSGILSGVAGSLTKLGTGILTLTGVNTYGGDTNLNAGTINVGNNSALGSGDLALNGGSLRANTAGINLANDFSVGGDTSIDGSNALILSGAGAITTGNTLSNDNTSTTTLSGNLSGAGDLAQNAGTLILSGNNSGFSGGISLNAGTLSVANNQGLGSAAIGVNNGTTLDLNAVNLTNAITLNNGTLSITGASSLDSNLAIGAGSTNIITAGLGSVFDMNGDIDGAGALSFQGAGDINLVGDIGSTTALTSVTLDANASITGSVATSGSQTFNNSMTLGADTGFVSTGGNIMFNGTIEGNRNLTITSGGTTLFAGAVGGVTPLASLLVNAANIQIDGGSVTTMGDQTYTGGITLGADTTLTTMGGGSKTISISGGVSGNQNLNLAGGASSNEAYMIQGSMAVNNVTVTGGGGGGSNSLMVNSGGSQAWTLGGADSGGVSGIAGVAGAFNFNNIQNLTGGTANDAFALNGNTLSGSINGGLGANSLAANNVTNSWMVTAPNAGTVTNLGGIFSNIQNLVGGTANDMFNLGGGTVSSVQGAGGTNTIVGGNNTSTWNFSGTNAGGATNVAGFTDIQNIMGGTGDNTFVFANGARLTGNLVGGSLSSNNTLDYSAYQGPVSVVLSATNNGVTSAGSDTITSFTSITHLEGNTGVHNMITLPNKANTITFTSAKRGFINDPIFFNGFDSFTSLSGNDTVVFQGVTGTFDGSTIFINGTPMFFSGFNFDTGPFIDVAKIIQQPDSNAGSSSPGGNSYLLMSESVTDNVNNVIDQLAKKFDSELNKVKINPYCFAQN